MQLFSADATIFKKKKLNLKLFFFPQKNIEKLPSKVAHNPTRPPVFSPASFGLETETLVKSEIFSSLKLSNFAV
jgi:hypothetical protein